MGQEREKVIVSDCKSKHVRRKGKESEENCVDKGSNKTQLVCQLINRKTVVMSNTKKLVAGGHVYDGINI